MPETTQQSDATGLVTNILSALQNGVIALSNLSRSMNTVATTTISTAAGTTTTVIHLIHVSS